MAGRHKYNDPESEHSDTQDRRPSIYAAFTLARLVHSFIKRVKSNFHSRQGSNKPSLDVSALRSYNFLVHPKSDNYAVDRNDRYPPITINKCSGPQQDVSPSLDRRCVYRRELASESSTIE